MIRLSWWLAEAVSQVLEPGEREAVLGDLAESGETGGRALCDVFGLVARRQASLWIDWRPWVALVGLVAPLGILFGLVSRSMAGTSAIYLWLYASNWDGGIAESSAFWRLLVYYATAFSLRYLTLACCSWSTGFALGFVSRDRLPANALLFGLLLFFGEAPDAGLTRFGVYPWRDFAAANVAVFSHAFYRVVFPLTMETVLVLIPSLWGMRHAMRLVKRRQLSKEIHT
jgi:hypothetical protein